MKDFVCCEDCRFFLLSYKEVEGILREYGVCTRLTELSMFLVTTTRTEHCALGRKHWKGEGDETV